MMDIINLKEKLGKFSDHWSPKVIAELNEGEMIVVPKGVEHKPYAESECKVMLVEPRGVVNTGEADSELTADNDIWI